MNVSASTPLAGVPSTDAPAASALSSVDSAGAFAAILDAASGNAAAPASGRAAAETGDESDPSGDAFAAIAAASLLAIAQLVVPAAQAQGDAPSPSSSDSVDEPSIVGAKSVEEASIVGVKTVDDADMGAPVEGSIDALVQDAQSSSTTIVSVPVAAVPQAKAADTQPSDITEPPTPDVTTDLQDAITTAPTRAVERREAESPAVPTPATKKTASESSDARSEDPAYTATAAAAVRQSAPGSTTRADVDRSDAVDTTRSDRATGTTERATPRVPSGAVVESKPIAREPHNARTTQPDRSATAARTASTDAPGTAALASIATATAAQALESPSRGSAASRFARAVERAAAAIAEQPHDESSAAANDANTGQGSTQSDGRGQSFGDREMQPNVLARVESPRSPVFTLTVPASLDFRGLAATDATIATSEGARMEIPDRDVAMQVVQSMRLQFRDGIGEAVLKLKPDHLGTVSISLRIENGAVSASVHAGVAEVRQWLESNQSMLRDSLAEQGLRLERFVVESDEKRHASSDESADRGQSRRRRSPRPRAVASDQPVFEVLA